jgi:glutathione synthase/RimK-type ligase-like ATP-grasp enzyme
MTILIIATPGDVHAQAVMAALASSGHGDVEVLDLSEFPQQLTLSMAFTPGAASRSTLRRPGGGTLDLASVTAVWWRRPQLFGLPSGMTDPAHRRYAASEAGTLFQGLYQSMDAFWVNRPGADAAASHKPWQLAMAQQVGLDIPATLMTNDAVAAEAFWAEQGGDVIHKQFIALPDAWRETRRLQEADREHIAALRHAPVIFQRHVPAHYDVRITAIGDTLFAAAAETAPDGYPDDIRFNLGAPYAPYTLPENVAVRLRELMQAMSLHYGAIDMRVTPEGQHIFLEINPAGQFLYVELATGLPIAAALAALLASAAT